MPTQRNETQSDACCVYSLVFDFQQMHSSRTTRSKPSSRAAGPKSRQSKAAEARCESGDPTHEIVGARLSSARCSKRLDLSMNRQMAPFQIFPRQVLQYELMGVHLTELWLTNHHLTSLPSEISAFVNLRLLGLGGNLISTLPEELSELQSLESLYLERNQLKTIPMNVQFPRNLQHLRLDHNRLSLFPVQVTRLRLLNLLGLSHNGIRVIPSEIRRLVNLVELDLDHNAIGPELPAEIEMLKRLERLGLEHNQLSHRPECLGCMPLLRYIRLSGNTAIPDQEIQNEEAVSRPTVVAELPCSDLNTLNRESYYP